MFTAGATWIAASQSFVTKVGGHFTHPSPWNWWLIVCIVGVGIGIFIFVATIRQGFLPKKFRFQDLSSQYTLGLLQPGVDPSETEHSYFYEISPFLKFLNGGSAVLEVYLEHLTAEANGQPMSSGNFGVRKLRILPER